MPEITFDHYFPYAELTEKIFALVHSSPNLMSVQSIGKSHEDRDIWCVTVTNTETGPAEEKPAFWVEGNIHATELSASSACLYFLNHLAETYGKDPEVTNCLDTRAFYVIPRLNPDGAEAYFSDKPRFLRSSTRPYPYDEDPLEGLKRQDVDGDGRILSMRIKDPNGPWKKHPEEPRLLVRRDATEQGGEYYRLLPEGLLENWDGYTLQLQRNKEGLDLNRNFPSHWRQEHEQKGAGPFPTSEPEVRTMVAFIASHPNITGGVSFHTYSGVLLRPYGMQSDEEFPAEDLWTYQKIGAKGTELTGYPNVSTFHDFKYHPKEVTSGVSDDWMYDHMGMFAWTVEIWSPQMQAEIGEYKFIEWYREHPFEDDQKMLKWSDEKLNGKGYVDWYPFKHSQLGEIELGGWDVLYAFRNPPPDLLEKELARFPDWLLWHCMISPRLELHRLDVEKLGKETYRVRLVVDNTGWLPTYVTKRAEERKVVRPVVVKIELPDGAELKSGKVREETRQLEGRAYTEVSPYGWGSDSTEERLKAEWVVYAPAGGLVKVEAKHDRAGVVRAEAELK